MFMLLSLLIVNVQEFLSSFLMKSKVFLKDCRQGHLVFCHGSLYFMSLFLFVVKVGSWLGFQGFRYAKVTSVDVVKSGIGENVTFLVLCDCFPSLE